MRKLLLLVLGVSLLSAETRQERGKRVVDEALAELGGDRFLAVKNRVEAGRVYSFYREELAGLAVAKIYTRYVSLPEKPKPEFIAVQERQVFGKDERSAILFTGEQGYEITFRGARPLRDEVVERFKMSTVLDVFYILRQRMGETGLIIESQGSDIYLNQPVEIVDITDSDNRVVTVYFHRSTKLPIRQVFYRRDAKTRDRIEEDTEYGKYRDVGGGVLWPYYMLRKRDGERVYQIFSETVSINQELSENLFTLPARIKILKKPG